MRFTLIATLVFFGITAAKADTSERQGYALDRLVNAQAQLEKLESQEKALKQLIRAVKKDLKAAKIRTKAEKVQLKADTQRQDAAIMVQETGVAVDLPDLINTKDVEAGLIKHEVANKTLSQEEIDILFKDDKPKDETAVFFPAKSESSDLPDYIK